MRALLAVLLLAATAALAQDKPEDTLTAVVAVSAKASPDARSAATLGTQRSGAGALIGDGYVLTIGYLVIEAEAIQVTGFDGKVVPATLAGYDHASGFGLLKLAAPLPGKPLALGDSAALGEREQTLVATTSERDGASVVYVVSRRPFTGSWEYQLDKPIFTYPAVDAWSGAPLINADGQLVGVGSLIVPDAGGPGTQSPGNMFVPVELLKPILADLKKSGKRSGPPRPWLGINADEVRGRLFVGRVSPGGPSEKAGLQRDDIVLAVAGKEVTSLAEFYRQVWARGAAGVDVPMRVLRGVQVREISVRSIDRVEYFRPSKTH